MAAEVMRRRQEARLSREEVADRCRALGWEMSAAGLANIETGRRDKDTRRRRREVTVDELVVLARALDVAPVLLMTPLGVLDDVEVLPGHVLPAWRAYQWVTGDRTWTGPVDDPRGGWHGDRAAVIDTYDRHDAALTGYVAAEVDGDEGAAEEHRREVVRQRHVMRSNGWRVPVGPAEDEQHAVAAEVASDVGGRP